MSRPRPRQIGLAFLLLAIVVAGFAYGLALQRTRVFPYGPLRAAYRSARNLIQSREGEDRSLPRGRWRGHETSPGERGLTEEQRAEIERLETMAYLSGSRPAPGHSGVTVYDPERTWDGLNLIVSGHAAWAGIIDMNGNLLHEWQYGFRQVWPDNPISDEAVGTHHWRYVHLFENGDILAMFEGIGIIKLDSQSNLVWDRAGGYHHELLLDEEGAIYTLQHRAHIVPRWDPDRPVLEHFVTVLDSEGHALRRVSLLTAFENSPYSAALKWAPTMADPFHSNSIQLLDGTLSDRLPAFRAGNVLLSIRELDTIAVIDLEAQRIVWTMSGLWRRQHDATLLPSGHILLFDNQHRPGISEVLEFDPLTQAIEWSYEGSEERPFYSEACGANHRLPNGNTLIVESDNGRAFEVTTEGTTVWEYVNPHRAGQENEFIATLFDVVRLPQGFPADWILQTHHQK